MRSSEESLRILQQVLSAAKESVDQVEASLGGGVIGLTRFASNEVQQSVQIDREFLGVRVVVDGRLARAQTSPLVEGDRERGSTGAHARVLPPRRRSPA